MTVLLASVVPATAHAQTGLNVRSVGEISVDAQGQASGSNLASQIGEAAGTLSGYSSLPLHAEIFQSVKIDGFAQAEKLTGVGSSTVELRGSNAIVSLFDNINGIMRIQATQPATVHYD
ncbi:MAG: hypothetical protein ACYDCK_07735, partial [Thermoplasmatota archaeon]